MDKIILYHKDFAVEVLISPENIVIVDSFRIKNYSDMENFLSKVKAHVPEHYESGQRTTKNMIREWRVHNLLYSLGILRERTRTVDLNAPQPWYFKIGYAVLSPFYLHCK